MLVDFKASADPHPHPGLAGVGVRTSGDWLLLALQGVGHPTNSAPKALNSWGPRVGKPVSLV